MRVEAKQNFSEKSGGKRRLWLPVANIKALSADAVHITLEGIVLYGSELWERNHKEFRRE